MEVLSRCYGNAPSIPLPDVIRLSLKGDVDGLTQCLSETGSSPDTVDADRHRTGLHHAAARGLDAVMATLLSAGADPNFRDVHGNTPLHLCGHAMTLTLLIKYGADPRLRNFTGVTAVEMMRRRGVAEEIVAKLTDFETGLDEEVFDAEDDEEYVETQSGNEVIALRQRRALNVESNIVADGDLAGEDHDTTEYSLHERLISGDDDIASSTPHYSNDRDDASVFTIGGCRRRRRGFRPTFESRPVSVFHEFFLSMDAKTLALFVFSIFCLALFAAFYVTGVHLNYFGASEHEVKDRNSHDGILGESTPEDNTVKMVPLRND